MTRTRSEIRRCYARLVGLCSVAMLMATPAWGASIQFTLQPFTGQESEVLVTLDDEAAGAGNVQMDVMVSMGVGDIRGIFFDLADPSLLAGLTVMGDDVTGVFFDVVDLGRGSNLRGGGSPCPCDVGVLIGRPGLRGGSDDFMATTLILSNDLGLDLSSFVGEDFGVRLTSVSSDGRSRDGSSKLAGVVVPEPSTGLLVAGGLVALARGGRFARGARRRAISG